MRTAKKVQEVFSAQMPERSSSHKNHRNPKEVHERRSWRDTTTQYGDKNKSRVIHKEAYQQYKKLMDEGGGRRQLWLQELAPKLQRILAGEISAKRIPGQRLWHQSLPQSRYSSTERTKC